MHKSRIKPASRSLPRRSARACSGCRLRKVRCDVTKRGFPCNNCQSCNMPCRIPVDRRGKLATAAGKENVDGTTPSDNGLITVSKLGGCMDQSPPYWGRADTIAAEALNDTRPLEDRTVNWSLLLPEYASPLSLAITREDCNVLHQEGAFDIPEARIRDELLRSYIQFVHPALPILNLENFLIVIDKSYTVGMGISFLLFQAVIFATTIFESEESLALEGFQDRREARKTRFDRLKMLYSFGCEDDRVIVLQTLLLMTYWDEKSDDLHDASYFVGVATTIWKSIETEPRSLEAELKKQKPELWKRISWSLYTRDRLVAINMRQPFHFNEADFQTPLLKLSDLEVGPLSTICCLGSDRSHPAIRDPSMHRLLAQISIALVQLCKCITRILNCQYNVLQRQSHPENTLKKLLVPKRVTLTSAELILRDIELEEWHDSLPRLLRWYPSDPLHQINKHAEVVLHFRAMLNGVYSLTSSTLHRPQIASTSPRIPELVELSSQRVHSSAMAVTQIYNYFKREGFKWLLPEGEVAMLESAIITHFGDLESTISSKRQEAMENFQLCAQALKQLGETYFGRPSPCFRGRCCNEKDITSPEKWTTLHFPTRH